jgi:hypothetical protein
MFLLYHSEGCNICELALHECYVNDLHTRTCNGMLGHHSWYQSKSFDIRLDALLMGMTCRSQIGIVKSYLKWS